MVQADRVHILAEDLHQEQDAASTVENEGHWAQDCKAVDWNNKCYHCGEEFCCFSRIFLPK